MKNDERWDAYVRNDATYDGMFYLAVKTTKIFCRPSCKARIPLRKNVEFFSTREECKEHNYRACKRCRPDLIEYNPQEDIANKAKVILDQYYDDSLAIKEALIELNITKNHLSLLFQKEFKCTPFEYRNQLRVSHAKELLAKTTISILEVALQSGFDSLSTFYYTFKASEHKTPVLYRRNKTL